MSARARTTSRASLYGLRVETDFGLHEAGEDFDGEPDVVVRTGEPFSVPPAAPPGVVRLDFATHEPWYTLTRLEDDSHLFRVHGLCDFTIAAGARDVTLSMWAEADDGMDGVITTGALLSLLLYLRGTPVFHGSAVDVDGQGVAFVGHSGQGKTTMATLLCAEGASAVTDDVLVIDDVGASPRVRRGSRELRLRSGIEEVAGRIDGGAGRVSADERLVVAPPRSPSATLPLRAIVIPRATRDGSPLRFQWLRPMEGALALLAFPRLMGWRDGDVLAETLAVATATAESVPVLVAHMPWGPPFPDGVTTALLASLETV